MTQPFNIESSHINALNDVQLTQLLKQLLHAEAYKFGLAQNTVEVALNIRVGDGGEDGRIEWFNGPENTDYLPNRLSMFQNKATEMGPTAYANEILTSSGQLKPKVEEVLDNGGAYIVFTTQELNTQKKDDRITAIREKLDQLSKAYSQTCEIKIYDASMIAGWANQFVSTIVSVQNWTGTPIERGLKTFSLWGEHEELSIYPYTAVDSRQHVVEALSEKIAEPKSCLRITGLSGLGKTRTAFHILERNPNLQSLTVYVDANHAPYIDGLVSDWVSLGLKAIIVVDNCEYRIHERLAKEVKRDKSQITLLTLDYNFDKVSPSTACFRLEPMSDEELSLLLSPTYKDKLKDLDRIVTFAQGFPQMAVLLAEARLAEDPRVGELTEDDLAQKLLWRRGESENPERLKVLKACALFDAFGIDGEMESQLEFISSLTGIDIDVIYECIQEYSERGIVDRRGRFGQIVPKPLAIRLAGQWWTQSRERRQKELIDSIPEDMIEFFCLQVEKLDFHSNVKKLTEDLCGPQAPFGQAEVILSIRGSRLFRSFVVVNPESTTEAVYRALKNLSHDELVEIKGDTRRNLVWALERLCYHPEVFEKAAWCMMLLASAENESWSNNAKGMFSQLFRVTLSGTSATPDTRFQLIQDALDLSSEKIDLILLDALSEAIETHGGSRTVGAEYQGSKPPLEEWRPTIWQEIFDYWQESFNLLLVLYKRGDPQKNKVLKIVGQSIRGLISRGRIEMLDAAIREIISTNGPYWPEALESIKHTFEFDSQGMRPEAESALNDWLELLNPENSELSEKLKILVVDPPWEHHRDDEGNYIDISAQNAMSLASEAAKNVEDLTPCLPMLLTGDPKQSFQFGVQICKEVENPEQVINPSLEVLLETESPNHRFILGLFKGLFERAAKEWQSYADKVSQDSRLSFLYPDLICTGTLYDHHLDTLLDLILRKKIKPNSASVLCYGKVTDSISPEKITEFCSNLSSFDNKASWTALNIIYMYCSSKPNIIEEKSANLKQLVTAVPLHENAKTKASDFHCWQDLANKLLKEHDEEFVIAISNQVIEACNIGFDYGDIWHHIKPLLIDLMQEYGDILWSIFGNAIANAEGTKRYWLQQIIERENRVSLKKSSLLSVVPVTSVIAWCNENQETGPAFVASALNIFEKIDDEIHPTNLFIAILENFGGSQKVATSLMANLESRGWTGSLVPYLESDKSALATLLHHSNANVRKWTSDYISQINKELEREKMRDEERDIGLF